MLANRIARSTATLTRRTGLHKLVFTQGIHTSSRLSIPDDKTQQKSSSSKDSDTLDQGHAASPQRQPPRAQVQSEYVQSGRALKEELERDGGPGQGEANPVVDAAGAGSGKGSGAPSVGRSNYGDGGSNPEGVGLKDQVGSAWTTNPSSARANEDSHEEATPPSFFSAVKSALGLGTSSGEVKQNRGGGAGVTGTGTMPKSKGQALGKGVGVSGGSVEYGRKRGYHSAASVGMGDAGVGGEVKEEHERVVRVVKGDGNGGASKEEVVEEHSTTIRRTTNAIESNESLAHTLPSSPSHSQPLSSLLTPTPNSNSSPTSSISPGHEPYRNVGSERPYEPPAEDASVGAKREVREKGRLRYGGVDDERMAEEGRMARDAEVGAGGP